MRGDRALRSFITKNNNTYRAHDTRKDALSFFTLRADNVLTDKISEELQSGGQGSPC